jgi:uncharacterized protein YkwD
MVGLMGAPLVAEAAPKKITKVSAPKVTGSATVGKTLKATVDKKTKPTGTKISVQWLRNGAKIAGATKASYKPTAKDVGKKLSVKACYSRAGYAKKCVTSSTKLGAGPAVTAPAPATPTPRPSTPSPTVTSTPRPSASPTATVPAPKPKPSASATPTATATPRPTSTPTATSTPSTSAPTVQTRFDEPVLNPKAGDQAGGWKVTLASCPIYGGDGLWVDEDGNQYIGANSVAKVQFRPGKPGASYSGAWKDASFFLMSECALRIVTPPGAVGDATVRITDTSGRVTAEVGYRYTSSPVVPAPTSKPTISSKSPASGAFAGGQDVTLTGSGFTGVTSVTVTPIVAAELTTHGDGVMPAQKASFEVLSNTSLRFTTPPGISTSATITVTNALGKGTSSFSYVLTDRAPSAWEQSFLNQLNQVRAEGRACRKGGAILQGAPLVWNPKLADFALAHAMDSGLRHYLFEEAAARGEIKLGHGKPGLAQPGDRFEAAGLDAYPEVASPSHDLDSSGAKEALDGWLQSPGHCTIILSTGATSIGVGAGLVPATVDSEDGPGQDAWGSPWVGVVD